MMEKRECTYCGDELSDEEINGPETDDYGDIICDDCYHENFEFTCDLCCEYGLIEDQHKMLIVWDEEGAGVPTGLYKIIKYPYYTAGFGAGWVHHFAIVRIDNAPGESTGYSCGHLCGDCQNQYLEMLSALREMSC